MVDSNSYQSIANYYSFVIISENDSCSAPQWYFCCTFFFSTFIKMNTIPIRKFISSEKFMSTCHEPNRSRWTLLSNEVEEKLLIKYISLPMERDSVMKPFLENIWMIKWKRSHWRSHIWGNIIRFVQIFRKDRKYFERKTNFYVRLNFVI